MLTIAVCRDWFEKLTADQHIRTGWMGRALLDGIAAERAPPVFYYFDYFDYFDDGDERLDRLMAPAVQGEQAVPVGVAREDLLTAVASRQRSPSTAPTRALYKAARIGNPADIQGVVAGDTITLVPGAAVPTDANRYLRVLASANDSPSTFGAHREIQRGGLRSGGRSAGTAPIWACPGRGYTHSRGTPCPRVSASRCVIGVRSDGDDDNRRPSSLTMPSNHLVVRQPICTRLPSRLAPVGADLCVTPSASREGR